MFTVGPHYDKNGQSDNKDYVDALAYDGLAAYQIASLPLPKNDPHPVAFSEGDLYVGHPSEEKGASIPRLERWRLDIAGQQFQQIAVMDLSQPLTQLRPVLNSKYLVGLAGRELMAFVPTSDSIRLAGQRLLPGCAWSDLECVIWVSDPPALWFPLHAYGVLTVKLNP